MTGQTRQTGQLIAIVQMTDYFEDKYFDISAIPITMLLSFQINQIWVMSYVNVIFRP